MKDGQSLYFDLIRFFMALEVMVGHATFHGYTGHGFLWQVDPFKHLQTAVIGFFVLSGFVIAYVADVKEKNGVTYTSARIARMHSIIVPALMVTLIFDWLGVSINPEFYQTWDFPTPIKDDQGIRYLLSFLYLNNTWVFPGMSPGTNGPFWTMTYEVMYYAFFGVVLYLKSNYKYLLVALLMAVAGPNIVILFPVWLLGVAVYNIQHRVVLPSNLSSVLFFSSLILIVLVSNLRPGVELTLTGRATHLDYLEGGLFALNIYAAAGINTFLAIHLGRVNRVIRWLGMLTFSLYLCHRPLLNFFSVFRLDAPASLVQKIWMFAGVFLIVVVVAYAGEWLRRCIRIWFKKLTVFNPKISACADS